MKFYRFLMIALLGGALVPLFFIKNKHGDPMLSLPGLTLPGTSGTGTGTITSLPSGPVHQQFYKWKDTKGQWHYGDKPPEGTSYKTVNVNTQTNIIQHTPVPKKESSSSSIASAKPATKKPAYTPPKDDKDALTLDRALNIVNDAKAVRDQMNERNKQLEKLSQ